MRQAHSKSVFVVEKEESKVLASRKNAEQSGGSNKIPEA